MVSADSPGLDGPGAAATAFAALSPSTIDPAVKSRLLALGLPVERIVVIEEVRGAVTVAGYGELRSAHLGDAILPTDALVLSSDSMLCLRLNNGGCLILDGKTRLQLEGLQYLDPHGSVPLKLSLMEGRLLVLPAVTNRARFS